MNNQKEDALFYVGLKAFIKKGDEVLILKNSHGIDFPGGKIQEGETDLVSELKREIREETGIEASVGDPFVTWIHTLPPSHRNAGKKVFIIGYKCEYVSGEVALSKEHADFVWVNKENYPKVKVGEGPFYKAVKKYFELN